MTEMTSVVLTQLAAGERLSAGQRQWLIETRDLVQLGMVAAEQRTRRTGTIGTFVRVEAIAVADAATADVPPDAGEARLSGLSGSIAAAVDAVRAVAERSAAPVTGFALHDLAALAGTDLPAALAALRDAGLTAVAEARLDRLEEAWLAAVASAGLPVQAVAPGTPTTGDAWLALLERVGALQVRFGVFRAFQPLALETAVTEPSTGYDDMRAVATARVLLPPELPHLQVHWQRAGAKLAQSCLLFGANDVDGVPARDAMPHGPRRAIVEEVRRNLVAVSLSPVERTAAFEPRRDGASAEVSA